MSYFDYQPTDADEVSLWEAVLELIFHPPSRDPLPHVTSLDDVIRLIRQSNNIIVLSGAGVSSSNRTNLSHHSFSIIDIGVMWNS